MLAGPAIRGTAGFVKSKREHARAHMHTHTGEEMKIVFKDTIVFISILFMSVILLIPETADTSMSPTWPHTPTHGCVSWVNPNLNSDNDEALI